MKKVLMLTAALLGCGPAMAADGYVENISSIGQWAVSKEIFPANNTFACRVESHTSFWLNKRVSSITREPLGYRFAYSSEYNDEQTAVILLTVGNKSFTFNVTKNSNLVYYENIERPMWVALTSALYEASRNNQKVLIQNKRSDANYQEISLEGYAESMPEFTKCLGETAYRPPSQTYTPPGYPSTFIPEDVTTTQEYADGRRDRLAYEAWFNGLPDNPYREGVWYFVVNRSKGPINCNTGYDMIWFNGCSVAQNRFKNIDYRRKTDKGYYRGWNSL